MRILSTSCNENTTDSLPSKYSWKKSNFLFSWYTECSSTLANNSELDALFSVLDHMDALNQFFDDLTSDMSYYLHEDRTEGEAWEKAEKANQQREGYAPKN